MIDVLMFFWGVLKVLAYTLVILWGVLLLVIVVSYIVFQVNKKRNERMITKVIERILDEEHS